MVSSSITWECKDLHWKQCPVLDRHLIHYLIIKLKGPCESLLGVLLPPQLIAFPEWRYIYQKSEPYVLSKLNPSSLSTRKEQEPLQPLERAMTNHKEMCQCTVGHITESMDARKNTAGEIGSTLAVLVTRITTPWESIACAWVNKESRCSKVPRGDRKAQPAIIKNTMELVAQPLPSGEDLPALCLGRDTWSKLNSHFYSVCVISGKA